MNRLKLTIKVLLSSFILLSIAISMVVLLGTPIYQMFNHFFPQGAAVGLTQEAIFINFNAVMDFLIYPWQTEFKLPDFSSSANGVQHFKEVKQLIQLNFFSSFVGIILLAIFASTRSNRQFKFDFFHWLGIAYYSPIGLLFLIVIAFDKVFIWFHQILFRNDLWLFDPISDPIINILPQSLFMTYFIIALLIYEGLVFIYRKIISF